MASVSKQRLKHMVHKMKLLKYLFLVITVAVSTNLMAIEILSKKEAERTFNKSFNEWKNDATLLVKSGQGQTIQGSDTSITMVVFLNNSILKVTPLYKENNLLKPWKVAVAVEKNKELTEKTKLLGDDGLRNLASKWYKEMMPEYTVMTEFDLKGEILQINFSIFEFGANSLIDSVGKETVGCWQGCIKK